MVEASWVEQSAFLFQIYCTPILPCSTLQTCHLNLPCWLILGKGTLSLVLIPQLWSVVMASLITPKMPQFISLIRVYLDHWILTNQLAIYFEKHNTSYLFTCFGVIFYMSISWMRQWISDLCTTKVATEVLGLLCCEWVWSISIFTTAILIGIIYR